MIITRPDGSAREAVLLSQSQNTIRVIMKGDEDVTEFFNVQGRWISENCEEVKVEFAWERKLPRRVPTEAECVCSKELADRLMHLLASGEEPVIEDATPEEEHRWLASRLAGGGTN